MNVLSLFDGMSCGRIALERAGIKFDKYYASEIDKYAIEVSQANYPDIIRLGDVTKWQDWDLDWSSIDLVIGGSPCQGFSFAGKGLAFDDPRSKLFFVFMEILSTVRKNNHKVKFLLENVRMKNEHIAVISEQTGVEPMLINSNLVSAQNRQRLYWCNFSIEQPEDKNINWGDIKEQNAPGNYYYSDVGLACLSKFAANKNKPIDIWPDDGKCQMIEASHYKNYSAQRCFGVMDKKGMRYITVTECEKAQTVPVNYTNKVSNSQRYKMLGNGWTVDVIAHIFKGLITTDTN